MAQRAIVQQGSSLLDQDAPFRSQETHENRLLHLYTQIQVSQK